MPGSLGNEMIDAQTFTSWGIDYLKYDNCYNTGVPAIDRYAAMGNAINSTDREMFYAVCNWGNENVTAWGPLIANSWRTTVDIVLNQDYENAWFNMRSNLLKNQDAAGNAGPGGWNDPDMLLLGANEALSHVEEKTHFALWVFAKAPLILSANVSTFGLANETNTTADILANADLIKIS